MGWPIHHVANVRSVAAPSSSTDRVGFVGLGIMGTPMAVNLVRAGVPLTVWNRSQPAVRVLEAEGAHPAQDLDELFARSDVVFLMLAHAEAIDAVLGPTGQRRTDLIAGRTIVNMGTVGPEYSRVLAADVRAAGGEFVEAPVSGSRRPAQEAALVGMLAGFETAVDRVTPLLRNLCASTTYCGDVPSALTMKLAVNVFLISLVTGVAESFHFAEQHGLDLDRLREILDAGQMSSPISRVKTAKIVQQDWAPQAAISDVLTNSSLITEAARSAGIASPLLDVCEELYREATQLGAGALDMAAVLQAITARSNA